MKFVKLFVGLTLAVAAIAGAGYVVINADQMQFESVCDKDHKRYTKLCRNVGKSAWNQKSVMQINEKKFGEIIGVAWRSKGSVISSRNQKKKRESESNSYYYIIGNKKDSSSQFLIITSEIDPR